MKKVLLFALASIFIVCITAEAQLKMDSSGDVGIGTITGDPGYKLDLRGQAYISCAPTATSGFYFTNISTSPIFKPESGGTAFLGTNTLKFFATYTEYLFYTDLVSSSDIKIKENIRNIEDPLNAIRQIRGIKYDLKRDYFINAPEDRIDELVESGKNKYGVVAQELREILPDLVTYDNETELYGVNYVALIPILVEAVKEQQVQIEELKAAIESSEALKGAAVNTSIPDSQSLGITTSTLNQNAPNPFTEETTITYNLAETVGSATLFIYDMSGKQLRSYNLHERGDSQINIIGGELDAGMYMYSLVADGSLIETKQMLLTD